MNMYVSFLFHLNSFFYILLKLLISFYSLKGYLFINLKESL